MTRYDVVVVGAGLAGLQCAALLARNSIRVLLVDRKRELRRPVHTTGIFVRRTLDDFDIPNALLGPPIRHVTLHSPNGRLQTLASPRDEFRVGNMGALYERMLRDLRNSGVDTMTGAHFRAIERNGETNLVGFETASGVVRIEARFVVGADGAESRVAASLGLAGNREKIVGVEEILHGVPLDGPPALHCFLDPALAPGYIGWIAHDGRETHIGVGGYAHSFSPVSSLARLRERVARLIDLSSATVVERRGGSIPVGGILPDIACSAGLLVGDAAGAVSPLTAGGLDGALRLSRYAAEIVGAAVKRSDPGLLSLYDGRLLDTRLVSRRWMRRILCSVRSATVVEAGCALLRLPPFSRFAWHVFFGRGSFPEPDRAALRAALGKA